MASIETTRYKVKIIFTEPILGTQPQKDVASTYIASKYIESGGELPEDEEETLTDMVENITTVFHKKDGKPILYDYQCKGFIKEAGRIFNGLDDVKALRSKLDNLVFVYPRQIELHMPEGSKIEFLERPLRAETAQGPRIALARSEMLPKGTWFEIELEVFKGPITEKILRKLFSYGSRKGIGQWRNGSYGRFNFDLTHIKDTVSKGIA